MNLWPYNMIRLWDSKEVFHTKSNICHFPSETVPQLLQNRAAWEKPSNGANRNPGAQSLRVFLFTSVLIFICVSFFFFLFRLCQKLKVSFTFSFLFAFSFFCLCLSLLGHRTIPSILCNFIKCKFHSFLIGVE